MVLSQTERIKQKKRNIISSVLQKMNKKTNTRHNSLGQKTQRNNMGGPRLCKTHALFQCRGPAVGLTPPDTPTWLGDTLAAFEIG